MSPRSDSSSDGSGEERNNRNENGDDVPQVIVSTTTTTTANVSATNDPPNPDIMSANEALLRNSIDGHALVGTSNNSACFSDDDNESGNILDRDYTGMFEGPEKTLEVVFRPTVGWTSEQQQQAGEVSGQEVSAAAADEPWQRIGLRRLSRPDLDRICARARCTILSSISNRYLDAYVLSESSLFIYPYMLVLKTCGTTTLLRCIAVLINLGRKLGLEIDWVGYSRKNFNFPGDQAFPHQSFAQELNYLSQHKKLCERLDGNGYTLGPVTGDHWFVFVADQTVRSSAMLLDNGMDTDRVLNIMMFDIDLAVAEIFTYATYQKKNRNDDDQAETETKEEEVARISRQQTAAAGIYELCPGAVVDPAAFEPCGYSMNAILFRSYSTIHITPESGSSYASFETNQKVASYKSLINNVIRTFRPKRFVMTLMADEGGLHQVKENPLIDSGPAAKIVVPAAAPTNNKASPCAVDNNNNSNNKPVPVPEQRRTLAYKRSSTASIKVEDDCCCMMGNWVLEEQQLGRAGKLRADSVS